MSWFYQAYFIVPSSRLTEGQFARTLDLMRALPRTRIPDWRPRTPEATLFTTMPIPDCVLNSVELGFDASSNEGSEHLVTLPPGYGFLEVSLEKWVIEDSVEQQRRLLEVLKRVFVGMDALLGVVDHEFAFDHPMGLEELASVVGGVTMVSDELLLPALGGTDVAIPGAERLDNGVCIHPCDEYFLGIPVDIASKVGELLERVRPLLLAADVEWPAVGHAGAGEGAPAIPGEAPGAHEAVFLQPMPGTGFFLWARYPAANHDRERARAFFDAIVGAGGGVGGGVDDSSGADAGTRLWGSVDHWVEQYLQGSASVSFDGASVAPGPHRRVHASFHVQGLSSRGGGAGLGPAFEREGEVGVLLRMDGGLAGLAAPEEAAFAMRLVRSLVLAFGPSFAFGHSDYNGFTDDYEAMSPPEGRAWPLAVYDTARMPDGALGRVRDAWTRVADTWALTVLGERWAVLSVNDLRTPAGDVVADAFADVVAEASGSTGGDGPEASGAARPPGGS